MQVAAGVLHPLMLPLLLFLARTRLQPTSCRKDLLGHVLLLLQVVGVLRRIPLVLPLLTLPPSLLTLILLLLSLLLLLPLLLLPLLLLPSRPRHLLLQPIS